MDFMNIEILNKKTEGLTKQICLIYLLGRR